MTHWRLALLLIAALLVLVALTYPTAILQREVYRVLFVFDISQSMKTQDVAVRKASAERLELAREAVRATMKSLPCRSEVGFGIFTEHRTLLLFAPADVCDNFGLMNDVLDSINWHMAWAARSEIAKGINSAMSIAAELNNDTRLVFFTDGHEAPPVNARFPFRFTENALRTSGILAGVGGEIPVPIPRFGPDGTAVGFWGADQVLQVDRHSLGRGSVAGGEPLAGADSTNLAARIVAGTEHLTSLKADYLISLAATTNLHYLRVTKPSDVYSTLRRTALASQRDVVTDVRWIPGLAAFALCGVACGFPDRRRG